MYPAKFLDDLLTYLHIDFILIHLNFLMTVLRIVGWGPNLHLQNGWGPWSDKPPWIRHCIRHCMASITQTIILHALSMDFYALSLEN